MADKKETMGPFKYDGGSTRYHQVRIRTENDGVIGSIYLPMGTDGQPENIILAYVSED